MFVLLKNIGKRSRFGLLLLLLAVGVLVSRGPYHVTYMEGQPVSSYAEDYSNSSATNEEADGEIFVALPSLNTTNYVSDDELTVRGGHPDTETSEKIRNSSSDSSEQKKRKLILFWTPKLESDDWNWGLGDGPFSGCRYTNCEFSSDKSSVREATLLLFFRREEPNFPSYRHPRQLYAHFSREPPQQVTTGYAMYGDVINMTISYRRGGNIYAPYFEVQRRKEIVGGAGGDTGPSSVEPYRPRIDFASKSRNVVWMTSNCRPRSKRDVYVKELRKYINVDVYGHCGNYTCELTKIYGDKYQHCFERFERRYKFYLAFENELCEDYYTEKLLNPLRNELVPIVLGGADYWTEMPKHSFINVFDFQNPARLAEFLIRMTKEEYYEYFRWKSEYVLVVPKIQCLLCEFLHNSPYSRGKQVSPPYRKNFTAWMFDSCDNGQIERLSEKW